MPVLFTFFVNFQNNRCQANTCQADYMQLPMSLKTKSWRVLSMRPRDSQQCYLHSLSVGLENQMNSQKPLWRMQKISFFYPVHTPKLHRTYFWFHGEGLVPFRQLWRFTEVLWHQNHRKGATGLEQNYSTSILLNLRTKFQSLQRATDAALWLLGIYERWSSPDTKL